MELGDRDELKMYTHLLVLFVKPLFLSQRLLNFQLKNARGWKRS